MTIKDDVVRVHGEHPEWTARQIAEHLGIDRYHVYNNARAEKLTLAAAPMPAGANVPAIATPVHDRESFATPAEDFIVYATDPAGMMAAQRSMIEWCDEKIVCEAHEQEQAQRNLDAAVEAQFSPDAWKRQVKLIGEKIDFYEKVKGALEAGYYIVPPFPIDVFAIRTSWKAPRGKWTQRNWRNSHEQKEQMLPAGDGDYVHPDPALQTTRFEESDGKGAVRNVQYWKPIDWRTAEFPFKLARAEILLATRAAMALKVFDRVGILPATRSPDPIVCGQIMMPHRNRSPLTFFVAWWLDTRTL